MYEISDNNKRNAFIIIKYQQTLGCLLINTPAA